MVATLRTQDFLGRTLTNAIPGITDATDYLGCAVTAGTLPGDPTDDGDRLGRLLQGP